MDMPTSKLKHANYMHHQIEDTMVLMDGGQVNKGGCAVCTMQ
jgi:hypothetical protein